MQAADNPLLQEWSGPHGLPPFRDIRPEHFEPAFQVAMREQLAEVHAIADQPEPPTFANTVEAFDRCGRLFTRIDLLFGPLSTRRLYAVTGGTEPPSQPPGTPDLSLYIGWSSNLMTRCVRRTSKILCMVFDIERDEMELSRRRPSIEISMLSPYIENRQACEPHLPCETSSLLTSDSSMANLAASERGPRSISN